MRSLSGAYAGSGLVRLYLGAHSPYGCTPKLLVEVQRAAVDFGLPHVIRLDESQIEVEIVRQRHGKTRSSTCSTSDDLTVLAHCVWLDGEEVELLARCGAGVAHNPVGNAKLAAMRRAGVPVWLNTDRSVSNNGLDIFQEMKFSVLLQSVVSGDAHPGGHRRFRHGDARRRKSARLGRCHRPPRARQAGGRSSFLM